MPRGWGELVSWGFLDLLWGVMGIVVSLGYMAFIDWRMMLIAAAVAPVLAVVAVQFKKRILSEYREVRKTNSRITGAYNENITGVRVVKSLRREEANLAAFRALTRTMYRAGYRAGWLSALFLPGRAAGHRCGRIGCCALWGVELPAGRHHDWGDPGVHFLYHLHADAGAGNGARVCRDAAGD